MWHGVCAAWLSKYVGPRLDRARKASARFTQPCCADDGLASSCSRNVRQSISPPFALRHSVFETVDNDVTTPHLLHIGVSHLGATHPGISYDGVIRKPAGEVRQAKPTFATAIRATPQQNGRRHSAAGHFISSFFSTMDRAASTDQQRASAATPARRLAPSRHSSRRCARPHATRDGASECG